ncbi:proteinase-activated receptor 3-like [Dryobates pubescens]|uniref:proteinase-activated receptor 3-like n=1 Tax=Dryobates pubescens TaxID=118200 RepID=UPI0023B8DAAB|nr:proteinase-activated receptor 3-like [Dryobates pubescens]
MSQLVPSRCSAAACVAVLLGCACLSLAAPSESRGQGRAFIFLKPEDRATCPGASPQVLLSSSLATRLLPALYSLLLLVGLPANGLACWVLLANFRRCSSSLFLLNLAAAHLLFLLVLPLKISYHLLGHHWLFGERLCRATVASFYGNLYGSILFVTCVGLERYVSVVHPFLWKGSSWAWGKAALCLLLWLLVGLAMTPLLLHPQTTAIPGLNVTTCHDLLEGERQRALSGYFLLLVGLGFGLPFVLMTASYSCILARLLAKGRQHRQVVRVLALVLLLFLFCFTPSNVLLVVHSVLYASGCSTNVSYMLYSLALVLAAFSTCFDPFLYFYSSQEFRGWVRRAGSRCLAGLEASSGRTSGLPLRSSEQSQL